MNQRHTKKTTNMVEKLEHVSQDHPKTADFLTNSKLHAFKTWTVCIKFLRAIMHYHHALCALWKWFVDTDNEYSLTSHSTQIGHFADALPSQSLDQY